MKSVPYRTAIADFVRGEARPVDKYGHQPRLYSLAVQVGAGQVYDDDVVYAAAWLHDLGVFLGHRPADPEELSRWDNVAYACEKAPGVLIRLGFPADKIPAAVETIRTHQPSTVPTSIEGVILRDADILEQLGAVGILRAVSKVGRDSRYPTFSDAIPVLRDALEKLPRQLKLLTSKKLAERKIETLRTFLRSVDDETSAGLF